MNNNKFPNPNYIYVEEDIPPNSNNNIEVQLPKKEVDDYEKKFKTLNGLKDLELRDKAFGLIVGLLILIVLFYVSDTILLNHGMKSSSLLDSIFELSKYMLSSLFGYVFAIKQKER